MPYSRLYYHLVWATARRRPVISDHIEDAVYDTIKRKVRSLGGEIFGIGGTEDHIHIAVTLPPDISITKAIGEVKGAAAFYINHLSNSPCRVDWHPGYGAVSFRKDNLDEVTDYVRRQRDHHALGHLWQSLEECEDSAASLVGIEDDMIVFDPYA